MTKSKITGLELPVKGGAPVEAYVKCAGRGLPPVPGTAVDGIKGKCPECTTMVELRGSCTHKHDDACGRLCSHTHTPKCGTTCGHDCSHKCGKKCLEKCAHAHTDKCGRVCKHECSHKHDDACTLVVVKAHLAYGKTPPVSAGTKGVNTAHPSRTYGERVNFSGNTPSDVSDVPPLVMGKDVDGSMPRVRIHKNSGNIVKTNGTNAGGLGRAHIVMASVTDLVGPKIQGRHGNNDPRVTRGEYDSWDRKARQSYTRKIHHMAETARKSSRKRRDVADSLASGPGAATGAAFEKAARSVIADAQDARRSDGARRRADKGDRRRSVDYKRNVAPVTGGGPTAVRAFGSVPVGTRVAQVWDPSKGGRFVDVIERRPGERSAVSGLRVDGKPCHLKYKSEPIFGRTVRGK